MFVNKDNDAFKNVLRSNYVDKTGLISVLNKSINSEYRFICVTRARRFGKSVTAQTINAYYSKGCNSKDQFTNLEIIPKTLSNFSRRVGLVNYLPH